MLCNAGLNAAMKKIWAAAQSSCIASGTYGSNACQESRSRVIRYDGHSSSPGWSVLPPVCFDALQGAWASGYEGI